jgi:N-acetylglucosamine kinase-like BadF-type ATPase
MTYVLGVDGGNSKTLAAVADETGAILGVGRSGNSNHQGVRLEGAMDAIKGAVEPALESAHLQADDIEAACYTLAGADYPEDFEMLTPALHGLGYGRSVGLDNDIMAGLRAGTANPNAAVVLMGAGMNAAGRNAAGESIRFPALGWISGDRMSGSTLAQEAVRAVARAGDGRGEPTLLTELVLTALGVASAEEMTRGLYFGWLNSDRVFRGTAPTMGLAPLVFRAANAGDAVALDLVRQVVEEVCLTARALLRSLGLMDTPSDVVLTGSVFRAEGPLLLSSIKERLSTMAPLAQVVRPEVEPVVGSVFLAMDSIGITAGDEARARAKVTYEERAPAGAVVEAT